MIVERSHIEEMLERLKQMELQALAAVNAAVGGQNALRELLRAAGEREVQGDAGTLGKLREA